MEYRITKQTHGPVDSESGSQDVYVEMWIQRDGGKLRHEWKGPIRLSKEEREEPRALEYAIDRIVAEMGPAPKVSVNVIRCSPVRVDDDGAHVFAVDAVASILEGTVTQHLPEQVMVPKGETLRAVLVGLAQALEDAASAPKGFNPDTLDVVAGGVYE